MSPRRKSHSFIRQGGGRDLMFTSSIQPSSKYMDLEIEVGDWQRHTISITYCPCQFSYYFVQGKQGRTSDITLPTSER